MSDWIEWNGGECPVPGDTLVEVKFRDGTLPAERDKAMGWFWALPVEYDRAITAYRIVKPSYEGEAVSGNAICGTEDRASASPSPRPWEQSISEIRRESCAVSCILAGVYHE